MQCRSSDRPDARERILEINRLLQIRRNKKRRRVPEPGPALSITHEARRIPIIKSYHAFQEEEKTLPIGTWNTITKPRLQLSKLRKKLLEPRTGQHQPFEVFDREEYYSTKILLRAR